MNVSHVGIILVIIAGILTSVFVAALNGHLFETSFADLSDDSEYYNVRALSLIHTGSLREEQALFRRPPGYSFFLAGMYRVFGEHIATAWLGQGILFGVSLFLLWRISLLFLSSFYALVPPLTAGFYWGFNFYVFEIGSELLAAALVFLLLWLFSEYRNEQRMQTLFLFGMVGGFLALTKPLFLYAFPVLLVGATRTAHSWLAHALRFGAGFLFFFLLIGGWAARTHALFGETEIERSGHIIYTRALYGTLSWPDIGEHFIASVMGDYVADAFMSGYAAYPVATRLGAIRKETFSSLLQQGYTRKDAEEELMRRGLQEMIRHPFKFTVGVVPLLFDLNTPENGSGFPVTRMFVGTHAAIPSWLKIIILASVRSIWFLFLGFVFYGIYRAVIASLASALPLLFLIAFFNLGHAFLIIPPEPRFLVPVLPLYFLFFMIGIYPLLTRVIKIRNVENI